MTILTRRREEAGTWRAPPSSELRAGPARTRAPRTVRPWSGRWSTALVVASLSVAVLLPARAAPAVARRMEALVFIVARSLPLQDVPTNVLRDAFRGLRAEYKGVRLIPFNLPLETAPRQQLDRQLLGLEPSEVGMYWVDQRVRDGRNAPRTVSTVERLVRVVAQLPGAVACVPATALDGTVRALRVDGKASTDNGYVLAQP